MRHAIGAFRFRQLAAQSSQLAHHQIALASQLIELGPHLLALGPGRGPGPVADVLGLILGGLQDALHAVGEAADGIRGLARRHRSSGTGHRPGTPGLQGPARRGTVASYLAVLVASAEIGPHPGDHPLQPGHVLIDLTPVIATEHDVEPRRSRRAGV
ncbi:MAG TPA: hypothetical protein VNA11_00250 [Pseudonocardia sp.]|jgi:hypothetical protein|nr:hypothetical protein [Pseudonocardia sp.]